MARRKKTSPAEDFIELVALLPWYVGLAAALLSYVLLHRVAMPSPLTPLKPGDMAGAMVSLASHGIASIAQYIVPLICLIGAVISGWRRHARSALFETVTGSEASGSLDGISWREFESLVGEGFRLLGYSVLENSGGGPDGGIDLTLRKDGEKYLVQCKQWRAFKVGVPVVRELYGVMAAKGAAGGFVVTSGQFTAEAQAFANGRNVELLDGPKLHQLLRQAKRMRASEPEVRASQTAHESPAQESKPSPETGRADAPSCPKCALPMVRRTAKKGVNAGSDFWGCSDYPRCRGTA